MATTKKYYNHIGGQWVDAKDESRFLVTNPANTDKIIGSFPDSKKADVHAAVRSARQAYSQWRLVPAPVRGDLLRKTGI